MAIPAIRYPMPAPRFGRWFASRPLNREVLLSTDIDDTLLAETDPNGQYGNEAGYRRTLETLGLLKDKLIVHLNTGRSLTGLKPLFPQLARMPRIDYLSLNNGQQLFVNRKHEAPELWLKGLRQSKENRNWQRHLKVNHHWDLPQIVRTTRTILGRYGFKEDLTPDAKKLPYRVFYGPVQDEQGHTVAGTSAVVRYYDDRSAFALTNHQGEMTPLHRAFGRHLADVIQARLIEKGIEAKHSTKTLSSRLLWHPEVVSWDIHNFAPPQINKLSVLANLFQRHPSIKAVITAGDHPQNDTELLNWLLWPLTGKTPRDILNFPILAGDNPALAEKLSAHPQRENVEKGDIGPAIANQFRKFSALFGF